VGDDPQAAKTPQEERPKVVGGDLVVPLAGVIFAIYYFVTIWDLTWEAQINGLLIGTVLIALVLLLLVRTARDVARGRARLGWGPLGGALPLQLQRAALLGLAILFIPLIQWLGFTLATGLFLFCGLYAMGVRDRRRLIGLPLGLSLAGYLLFIVALDTRFPYGPVEHLLGRLF